jgi:two-component system, chemotaxis family, chemotaxis protein CheY
MLERKMKRVLVIEDDASLGWLLERMLRGKYEVILMNNALDAWSWLTDGNVCDLVITDLNMPSLSGLQLL